MNLEDFIYREVNKLIKFMVWWNYKVSIKEDGFSSSEMSTEDWLEQYVFFSQDEQIFDVPEGFQLEDFEIDSIRSDLMFQLKTPEDLDWDYFLETSIRAKIKADATGVNMTRDKQ
ncbi:hypothetical protein OTK49_20890 [Vibrio coralliirubri]|uniref:hypothetical protein n=1 Tax=Vibrio coralliirubri TaxID=1516159 RepID=UPI0022836182|nr:hypothetical protein [Vibrio coralliirubri]MCY9864976.1 hypothetical protein [Vibrio coralliirubri]